MIGAKNDARGLGSLTRYTPSRIRNAVAWYAEPNARSRIWPGGSPPSFGTSTVTRPNIATITTRAIATRRSPLSPPSARTWRSLRWASRTAICVPRVFNPPILLRRPRATGLRRRRLGHFVEDLIDPIAHGLL